MVSVIMPGLVGEILRATTIMIESQNCRLSVRARDHIVQHGPDSLNLGEDFVQV